MSNIRPIVFLADESLPKPCVKAILEGIREIVQITQAGLEVHEISSPHIQGRLDEVGRQSWGNPKWYVDKTINNTSQKHYGLINANRMLFLFHECILGKIMDPYYVFATGYGLHSDGTLNLVGWYKQEVGCVISIYPHLELTDRQLRESIKTVAMHNLGHVFGLIPDDRTSALTKDFGIHCANRCIMRQGYVCPDTWLPITKDRLKGVLFCKDCEADLRKFFAEDQRPIPPE